MERPTAVRGTFEEEYLSLPRDVLITVMKKHQRYFPVISDSDSADLLPYFIAVRNGDDQHLDLVCRGYEEVLRARYADADFFFKGDTSKPLEDFLNRLDTLTFQEKLGSMLEKSQRLEQLVPLLGQMLERRKRLLRRPGPPDCARLTWPPRWWSSSPVCRE